MNLGKLLGAGKSFFGGHGVVSYRENKRVYVPKFTDAENNPFAPKPKDVEAAGSNPVAAPVVVTPVASAKVVLEAPQVNLVPAPVLVAAKPSVVKPVAAKPVRAGWAGKLNPFKATQPVEAPPVAMQPEFSLDAVKVLHNDLSDADVEVVPVKSRVSTPAEAASPADYMNEPVLRAI